MSDETEIDWTPATKARAKYEPMIEGFNANPSGVAQLLADDERYKDGLQALFEGLSEMRRALENPGKLVEVPKLCELYWMTRSVVVEMVHGTSGRQIPNDLLRIVEARMREGEPFQKKQPDKPPAIVVAANGSAFHSELLAAERWALAELNRAPKQKMLSVEQFARSCAVNESTVRRWAKSDDLPGADKSTGKWLIPENLLAAKQRKPGRPVTPSPPVAVIVYWRCNTCHRNFVPQGDTNHCTFDLCRSKNTEPIGIKSTKVARMHGNRTRRASGS